MLSLIIPTYNERENIEKLIKELFNVLKKRKFKFQLIVVDDNSPDGTAEVVKELSKKYNVKLLVRPKKLGLTSAILDGFALAKGNLIGVMDADFSHSPKDVPKLVEALKTNDIVIGSRCLKGSEMRYRSIIRKSISILTNFLVRIIFRLDVKDPLSGFFFLKREIIEKTEIKAKGFKILLNTLVRNKNKRIKEVPICFVERKKGKSKFGIREIIDFTRTIFELLR